MYPLKFHKKYQLVVKHLLCLLKCGNLNLGTAVPFKSKYLSEFNLQFLLTLYILHYL